MVFAPCFLVMAVFTPFWWPKSHDTSNPLEFYWVGISHIPSHKIPKVSVPHYSLQSWNESLDMAVCVKFFSQLPVTESIAARSSLVVSWSGTLFWRHIAKDVFDWRLLKCSPSIFLVSSLGLGWGVALSSARALFSGSDSYIHTVYTYVVSSISTYM